MTERGVNANRLNYRTRLQYRKHRERGWSVIGFCVPLKDSLCLYLCAQYGVVEVALL